ncbi:hypothetical protein BCR33DRAFT_758413 [Rhizoclosmatium globosum]|uniref:Uncharacterized protein n=1 Tax=Rhizoclosmatium globosum TaxID=329046 RepID=A0A1Y2C4K6_9FUNG|nr:hypothetical protein BCR33DRAFT_758413 [Rhizoclosmatium globosum]|eukprot:ORY41255.1 hypothetical protein BCR33DRAFT_758413 [Rhizoclosmatium globosum]
MAPALTAGEECKAAAQALSAFTGTGSGGNCIPKNFISMAMAIAIFRGENGVAMVRLKSGDWSAPCAIILEVPHGGNVQPGQDTVLLFMTETSVLALVARTRLILNGTHRFEPGVYSNSGSINSSNDIYAYVRFNNQFTLETFREDMTRHARWHGVEVTWADVLMNKITVDRSSIGNALYLVVNIAAGGNSQGVIEVNGRKNFADLDKLPTRIGLDGEAPRASVSAPAGPSPEQLAELRMKEQQEAMQQLLMQQQMEQQQLMLQQQQMMQQQPSQAMMAGANYAWAGVSGYGMPLGRMNSGSTVSQELLIQQQQHQIDSAQIAVGTMSIEEQLRRLKQQTSQIEQSSNRFRRRR